MQPTSIVGIPADTPAPRDSSPLAPPYLGQGNSARRIPHTLDIFAFNVPCDEISCARLSHHEFCGIMAAMLTNSSKLVFHG